MKIRKVNISTRLVIKNHNINANEEGDNKEVNGRIAVSGQKIKHCMFETIRGIDKDVFISNGDGATGEIDTDLRSDLGGYMITFDKDYSNRRTSPISVGYAVSENKSSFFDDLFVRFRRDEVRIDNSTESGKKMKKHNEQRINNKRYSEEDTINFVYSLDLKHLSSTEYFNYDDGKHLSSVWYKHVDEDERRKRMKLFIQSTSVIEGFANQSRNAVVNTPVEVFISFNDSSEFIDYFNMSDKAKENLLKNLDSSNIKYFIGSNESDYSVNDAYKDALIYADSIDMFGSDYEVKTQKEIAKLNTPVDESKSSK